MKPIVKRIRGMVWVLALSSCFTLLSTLCNSDANAQGYGSNGFDGKHRTTDLQGPANPLAKPTREYMGVPVAGWMVNADVLTGITWDDNVFQANINSVDDWAARIRPQIEINRNNGIHSTTLYGYADARFYDERDDADHVKGAAGARHVWEVQRDFIIKTQASYNRNVDINNSGTIQTANGLVRSRRRSRATSTRAALRSRSSRAGSSTGSPATCLTPTTSTSKTRSAV